jgi:hypothetical protein
MVSFLDACAATLLAATLRFSEMKRYVRYIPRLVGANYREASRGRSKAEFASKIGDCLKETDETEYWLELLVDSGCVSASKMAGLLDETNQLLAIFTTIAKRSKGVL